VYWPAVVWFTDADLRHLAGGRSYERGLGYLSAVSGIADLPDGVTAIVHGTGRYRVRLTGAEDAMLDGDCTCPYGRTAPSASMRRRRPAPATPTRAAQLLLTMRPRYARVGDDFARYSVTLKAANRRKRNFLAELARNGL
jgi:hypothetical protein